MAENGKTTMTPRLRFPEFRDAGEWEDRELGSMTNKIGSGITPLGGDKTYKPSGRPFIRSQNVGWGHLLLDDVAFIDEEAHASFDGTEILPDDVLLNITGASIGRSAIADARIIGGNVNQHVCIIRVKRGELKPILLNQFLISERGQAQINSFQAGGNRQGLNFAQIRSFKIPLPPTVKEQTKIADCLASLDACVAAQGRKVEALKVHKRGLMQQLFPRKGETLPRRRFPEFRNAGAWEERQLSASIDLVSGLHLSPDQYSSTEGVVPYFTGPSDFTNDVGALTKWTSTGANTAKENDTLITVKGSGVGEIWYLAIPSVAIGRQLMAVRADGCSSRFIYYSLLKKRSRFEDLASGNLIPGLSRGDILDLPTSFPSVQEQHRIAYCISSLDAQIAAESEKLDALKTHKKGLMQQLFPYPKEEL
jgi:type I restriction enzyme, S subunit